MLLAPGQLLGKPGLALPPLEPVYDAATLAACAEASGVPSRLVEDSLAYARERRQFGQPIAQFQVLQHRLADMFIALEQLQAVLPWAAAALDGPAAERQRAVSSAKVCAGRAGRLIGQGAVQLHGGMGMTEELAVGHYFRRATLLEQRFGSNGQLLRRVAALMDQTLMDFSLTHSQIELQQRTRAFIAEQVIPCENDVRQSPHGPDEALRLELVTRARAAGLLTPHASRHWGGLGLTHVDKAILFEEAGYSPLGPVALNIHAPDEGNIHLLEQAASPAQQQRWLAPLVAGQTRSCFCMTEPPPGAGSDPGMLLTRARRDGDAYVIDGRKRFITGASGAAFAIIMARLEDYGSGDPSGATMFLADMDQPGIRIERQMEALDACFTGGHAELAFEGLRVPLADVLGEPGQGLRYAQLRLAPARLTHCMRWLGAARRAHEAAAAWARSREAFGQPLAAHEGVSFQLADNEIELHAARLMIWHCAWLLDQGGKGRHESSVAKVFCSEAAWRIVDRSVQILGGAGVTDLSIVARIFRDMRAFRIYDGPSEVHRWSIGRAIAKA